MVQTSTIKTGMYILFKDEPHKITESQFSTQGRVSAYTRTKLKSLLSGKVISQTFRSGEKVEEIEVPTTTMQYTYKDDNNAYVMDKESFAQHSILLDSVEDIMGFVKEGDDVIVQFYDDKPISMTPRPKVNFKVVSTIDAVKGNTSTNAMKAATIETGKEIDVPLFISEGDEIIVNTENGQYVSKA